MKLHIGCGKKIIEGWTNLDIEPGAGVDVVDDARKLTKIADDSCDLIYACHVLEHVGRKEVSNVLKLWHRKLRPRGTLRLAVPDFEQVVARFQAEKDIHEIMGLVVGGQRNQFDHHHMIFDLPSLTGLLNDTGFHNVRRWDWQVTDHKAMDDYSQAHLPHLRKDEGMLMSLNLEATA